MTLATTEEGFLLDWQSWNETVAAELAAREAIQLSEAHWEVIYCIRNFYARYDYLPDMRIFVKALRLELGEEKGNTPYLYRLFREAPLKLACKIGGLPKPSSCI